MLCECHLGCVHKLLNVNKIPHLDLGPSPKYITMHTQIFTNPNTVKRQTNKTTLGFKHFGLRMLDMV